jgi:hypothetical protein
VRFLRLCFPSCPVVINQRRNGLNLELWRKEWVQCVAMSPQNLRREPGKAFFAMAAVLLFVQCAVPQSTDRNPSAGQGKSVMRFAERFSGETADKQINAAIRDLNGRGGIVDAREISGAQTVAATINIPANTTVLLGPSVVYTCTVASGPCWRLYGQGGSQLNGACANFNVGTPFNPDKQNCTILKMGGGINSDTDMVEVNPNPGVSSGNGGFQVSNLTIDFGNRDSAAGRNGIVTYGINHSVIQNVQVFNPGNNCFEFETLTGVWSYDDWVINALCMAPAVSAFNWTTEKAAAAGDFDRWHCIGCKASPGPTSRGIIQVHLTSGNSASCTIADFFFDELWIGGTQRTGQTVGFQIDKLKGDGYISNINVSGEIEQRNKVGNGLAVVVNNSGAPWQVLELDFSHIIISDWNHGVPPFHNMTAANVHTWWFQSQSSETQAAPYVGPIGFLNQLCIPTMEGSHVVATNCSAGCYAGSSCTPGGSNHCELYCNGAQRWIETGR